jgi:hypothetical protein
MSTEIEERASRLVAEMRERIATLAERSARVADFALTDLDAAVGEDSALACAGNQHTCQPQLFIPAMDRRFAMILTGTGDSVIVGDQSGPRALMWQNTTLQGEHPELGKVSVSLEPASANAGTLLPILADAAFPAVNRNNYFFVFNIETLGEMISERPAIVEALIDEVPPTGAYVFRNGPVNFYLLSDPSKTTVAVLEAAVTDVAPA